MGIFLFPQQITSSYKNPANFTGKHDAKIRGIRLWKIHSFHQHWISIRIMANQARIAVGESNGDLFFAAIFDDNLQSISKV